MSSTRKRGRGTELKTKRYFEALGYRCQLAPMPTRWSLQNDLMGLWDLVAVNEKETIWAQIKTNRNDTYGKKLDRHRAWVIPPCSRKLLVLWKPYAKEPEITEL